MFMRMHHALRQAYGRRVQISPAVQGEIIAWRQLVQEISDRQMHLRKLDPSPPEQESATDSSRTGMGGV